jgi:argininosuccinate lyase
MTDLLWNKSDAPPVMDAEIMEFLAGEDLLLDRELLPFDLAASAAHARGLAAAGVLQADEAGLLANTLARYQEEFGAGKRRLERGYEDGHSAIEAWLIEDLGDLGKKIHTGRSRNDQVAVALRLYMKNRLGRLSGLCLSIAETLLERAGGEQGLPIPGYTHLQRAMPSSAGLWLAGHAEAYLDDAQLAQLTSQWLDASPLGTASGFGVNLPLPRAAVAEDLGFARLVVNPQCAQNSRGKVELQAVGALAAATLDLQRLAWDLSLFCTEEFGFVVLPERYCTGSSIMPNKRNPDVVELLRSAHAAIVGSQAELQAVLALPSGYQRDLQATKPPLLRAFAGGLRALALLPALLRDFSWNEARLRAACTPEMFATDRATRLAVEGVPFREAYRTVAAELAAEGAGDPEQSLAERVSPGACGNLQLDELWARHAALVEYGNKQAAAPV